jgi:hypothetical protein
MEDIKKASLALASNYAIFARYNDRVANALLSKLGRFSPGEIMSHLEEVKRLKAEAALYRAAAEELKKPH